MPKVSKPKMRKKPKYSSALYKMPDLRKDCVVRGLNENIIPLNKCKIENKLCSEGRLDEGYLTYTAARL